MIHGNDCYAIVKIWGCKMKDKLNGIIYKEYEPMSRHSTFRIGGEARYYITPASIEQLLQAIHACKESNVPYVILGNGSNVLFLDEGYKGAVIAIGDAMSDISIEDETIYAQAGAMLAKISMLAKEHSLTGMEFASGIPGTIGGAIVMNAGAYGGEMKDIVASVDLLEDDEIHTYSCEQMQFAYRHSIVDATKIVVGMKLRLKNGDYNQIVARMEELKTARVMKQPLEYPSAGSTFKRPEGYFAAKLIDDCGLRGFRVGGAMVSEKHCGFVVNYDHATANDVITLMDFVTKKVYETFQVTLEPEVKIIRCDL